MSVFEIVNILMELLNLGPANYRFDFLLGTYYFGISLLCNIPLVALIFTISWYFSKSNNKPYNLLHLSSSIMAASIISWISFLIWSLIVLPISFQTLFPMILYILITISCLVWNRYQQNTIKQIDTEKEKTAELTPELQ